MSEKDKKVVEGVKASKVRKAPKRVKVVKEDTGAQVSALTKENAQLREKVSELKDKLSQLSKENQELRSANLAVRIELSTANSTIENQKRLLDDYEEDVVRLRNRSFWDRVFNK